MTVPTPAHVHLEIPPLEPSRVTSRYATLVLLFLLLLPASLLAAHNTPTQRILLESLNFQPISSRYLLAGSSMLTLHYVDDTHLLVTFAARRLLRRIPNDPPSDQDHNTDAVLIELPSGRVLARAEWLLHDHGQYLWNLGHGQFLFRVRNNFSILAPLEHLAKGQAFAERPFIHSERQIVAVIPSADSGLLTVESIEPPAEVDPQPPSSVQLNFYRLRLPSAAGEDVVVNYAGGALARGVVDLPLSSVGMINVIDQGKQQWAFDFRSHTGKVNPLNLYDSTCRPLPLFVTASEYIVFSCRGGTVRQQLSAFNLRGDQMWEQTLTGSYIAPHLEFAPSVGRFALGRLLMTGAAIATDTLDAAQLSGQSVDVYQIDSGKQLLHIDCTPIARAGQNFTFSPDGMNFAVIRDGAIEIYRLPSLDSADKKALKLAQASAPPPNDALVDLSSMSTRVVARTASDSSDVTDAGQLSSQDSTTAPSPSTTQDPAQPSSNVPVAATSSTPNTNPTADPDPAEPPKPRKSPTLYNPPAPDPAAPPQL